MPSAQSIRTASSPLRVRDIMSVSVLTVSTTDNVRVASQMLTWGAFHHLPVVDGDKLVGVVTRRELTRVRGTKDDPSVLVGDVMVSKVITTQPDELVADAADRMVDAYVGCLPVLEHDRLVGILTTTDVLASADRPRLVAKRNSEPTVSSVMCASPHTVQASTKLTVALAMMAEHDIRHLPVVDDTGKLRGMMSDRDIRTAVGDPLAALYDDDYGPAAAATVADVMSDEPVISVRANEPLSVLSFGFVDQRVGAVPVVDEHKHVIGIVSYVDLLHRALAAR